MAAASIFAVAASSEPDQILRAMRAGANEYLAWSFEEAGAALTDSFQTALKRTVDRHRPGKDSTRSGVTLSFFGAKGGAGTTTLAVNSAIDIARLSKRPTLIVDLHQFVGEVALFLGVRPRFTLIDALDNLHRMDQEFMRELVVKHKSGLDILAGGDQIDRPGPHDAAGRRAAAAAARPLATTSSSSTPGIVTGAVADVAVFAADTIYLVANPDIASVRNAHRIVDRFEQLGAGKDRLRVLLNRMSDQNQIGPKQIEMTLGHSLHMMFPSDYSVVSAAHELGRAADADEPFRPCRAIRAVHQTDHQPRCARGCRRTDPREGLVPGIVLRHGYSCYRQAPCAPGSGTDPLSKNAMGADPMATRAGHSTWKCAAACIASC